MVFTFPWALAGLVAMPALAAIYFFRKKSRRHVVSSLMLWLEQKRAREGGLRFHKIQTPLLFFLELVLIALLVTAAAGPRVLRPERARPLTVVLDDSYSMRVGEPGSPRKLAEDAIRKELSRGHGFPVRFILAGKSLQVLGEPARTPAHARTLLKNWTCRSPSASLEEGIALAASLGERPTRILVVTDHPPATDIEEGKVEWWAFGIPRSNVAFTNASRTRHEETDHLFLEVTNLSSDTRRAVVTVEELASTEKSEATALEMRPGEARRLFLKRTAGDGVLEAKLDNDSLDVDNRVVLVPEEAVEVRTELQVRDQTMRDLLEKAVQATGIAALTTRSPELLFTDEPADSAAPDCWRVHLLQEKDASAYIGPFVVDRSHPLTEGLSLEGVVWAAGKSPHLPGVPIITAGNISLMTESARLAGRREVRMRLRPDLSTLQDSPNWPILIRNLVEYRAAYTPGLRPSNLRPGMEAVFVAESGCESAVVVTPAGESRQIPLHIGRATILVDDVGVYEVRTDKGKYSFACNALCKEESDLRDSASGRWGNWRDRVSLRKEHRSIGWIFLLASAGLLMAHAALLSHSREGRTR